MKKVLLLITALFLTTPSIAMFKAIETAAKEFGTEKRAQREISRAKDKKKRVRRKNAVELRKSPNPVAQKKINRKLNSPHGDLDRQSPFAGKLPSSCSDSDSE